MSELSCETAEPKEPGVPDLTVAKDSTNLLVNKEDPDRFRQLGRTVLRFCGVDRAIAYTLAGRGWNVISGPLTLLLIARFLGPAEQGFYFTFSSVIALNIFFELGLTFVVVQFASHEKAHLEWTDSGTLIGPQIAQARLAALLKMALKWYAGAALLVMLLLMPGGLLFFTRNSAPGTLITWRLPWIWLATVSALNLLTLPLLAVIEGCGKISHIASMRAGQSIFSSLGLWLTLWFHGALFAGPVMQMVNVVYAAGWIGISYGRFLKTLLSTDVSQAPFNWVNEVWPFQWRMALSWLSGYFIFQLFNPVLFATRGAIEAGRMGMSITVCNALLGVSVAWMSTKASPFGVLVAKKQWKSLDTLFFKTFRQSTLVAIAGSISVCALIALLGYRHHPYAARLLPLTPFLCLLIATVINHVVFCEAQYLRTHKTEPFLWVSVTSAILTASCTFLLAKPYGAAGVSGGYLFCCVVSLVLGTKIFVQKRKEWHA